MKCMKVHGAKDRNTVTFLEGKHVENTGGYKDMGTKRQDIRTLSKRHPKMGNVNESSRQGIFDKTTSSTKEKQSSRNRHGN